MPLLERAPSLLPDAGQSIVQRYVGVCDETEREPDEELLQRMHEVLVSAGVLTAEEEG